MGQKEHKKVHPNSQSEKDKICQWANTPFPFSVYDEFGRYGALGVLGYIALLGIRDREVCIVEIGTGESSIYLTQLALRFGLKIFYCDIAYSKIYNPSTVEGYLHPKLKIIKHGYEAHHSNIAIGFAGSSNRFFKETKIPPIGIAYIDGDHLYKQVKKDFDNIFPLVVDNGYIFIHDTYPPNKDYTTESTCGEVYKLRQELEKRDDIDVLTFTKAIGCGVGITMVRKKPKKRPYYHD